MMREKILPILLFTHQPKKFLNLKFCFVFSGLAGWTPVPPHVYIKAKQERDQMFKKIQQQQQPQQQESDGDGGDNGEEKIEIESILPKRLPF